MPHWKTLMDKEFIYACDLDGKDATLEVKEVTGGEITGEGGKKTKRPVATFTNAKKKLALNSTNCKIIAALYGNEVLNWRGKLITLYPTTTTFGSQTVDCIRVRPAKPRANGRSKPQSEPTVEPIESDSPPPDDVELPS